MRDILDPLDPADLRPSFRAIFRRLQRGKMLQRFAYLDGHYLLSLDGTGYFSSAKIHCLKCAHKFGHENGGVYIACTHARAECFSFQRLWNSAGVKYPSEECIRFRL